MAEQDTNHDIRGRFKVGNKAARGRRSPVRTPEALIETVERRLETRKSERTLTEFVGDRFLRLISAAGNGDVRAGMYVVDRMFPAEREPVISRQSLPSPTKRPVKFVDALARSVTRGQMTTTQAARLANLAKPLIIDETLRGMVEELAELRKRVNELGQQKLSAVQ